MRMIPVLALALMAASAPAAAPAPRFDAIAFFRGKTEGFGRLKVVLRAAQDVKVAGLGHVQPDGTLVLDQMVTRAGTTPKPRQWRIRAISPGRYTGTLTDAKGAITGEASGDRLHLAFTSTSGFAVEQWLVLSADGRTAQNTLTARRFGITVARLEETIRKTD